MIRAHIDTPHGRHAGLTAWMAQRRTIRVLVAAMALLTGCAGQDIVVQTPTPVAAPVATPESVPKNIPSRPFATETLYDLLVAEFAVHRKQFNIALAYYMKQAFQTRDAGIAEHAWRLARYLRANRQALEIAELWVQLDPESLPARYNLAGELVRSDRPFEAMAQMKLVREGGGETNFGAIANSALERPAEEQKLVLSDIDALLRGAPIDTDLLIAQALLRKSAGQSEEALESVAKLLSVEPTNTQGLFIEAQLLYEQGNGENAFNRIERILQEQPDNARLRLQYARMLTKVDLSRAEKHFEILASQHPEDGEMLLALAMVYRENEHTDKMREQLERLLELNMQTDAAHFYLAVDDEQRGDVNGAIEHYFQVGPSTVFGISIGRGAKLLVQEDRLDEARARFSSLREQHPDTATQIVLIEAELLGELSLLDEAHEVLSQALEADPSETQLLYARSMISEKRHDVVGLERDLREMLRLEPDSPLALNALGYSLTNLTDRHREALELISRALELKPEDPAILDSMGWVHFRLGNANLALDYLKRAFELMPDPEIAAHLGEVLWTLGKVDEAREVWRQALEKAPESPIVQDTIGRLLGTASELMDTRDH